MQNNLRLRRLFISAISIAIPGFIASAVSAQTAPPLTLALAIKESTDQSPTVQKAKAQADEASWKNIEAGSAFLPTLSGQVNYLTNKQYMYVDVNLGGSPASIAQVVPVTQYTLSAKWNVFDGFASSYRLLSTRQLKSAAQNDYEWSQFQTERQTLLAFYKLLASKQINEVALQNFKALSDHLKNIESAKKVGLATQYDVLRTQVQVSEAQSEVINSEDNIQTAYNKLAEILGKDSESRDVVGSLPVLKIGLIDPVKNLNLEKRKDLLALQQKEESSQYNYQSINKHYLPKISLFADYQYYNNRNDRFSDTNNFREGYLIGVNLLWNFFDGFGSMAKSGQAEAQALQVQKALQISQLKSKSDFDFWKRKFTYYCSLYKAKSADIDRSNEAVRLAQAGQKAGTRTNTETLDAQADLYRSKAAQINAQVGAIEALVNIELATGEKLYNFTNE